MKSNIAKIYFVRFFMWTHFFAAIMTPFFMDWGRITFAQIMLLNAWFMLWGFIFEIPTGSLADFVSRKFSIALGCFVGALASIFYISYPSFFVFFIGEILFALAFALISGADEALIYDTLKELKEESSSKKIFGKMESFKLAGILIGALAGSLIAKFWGLPTPLLLMSITFTVAGIIALTLVEPKKNIVKTNTSYFMIIKDGVSYFLNHKTIKILVLDMVLINSISWTLIWLYQQLLKFAGVDIVYFGVVHSLMTITQIYLILNFTNLENLLKSKKQLLFLTGFLSGLFFLILGFSHSIPIVIIAISLASGFGLSRISLFSSYINKHVESDKRGTVLSTVSMFRTLGIVILNPIVGFLAERSIYNTAIALGSLAIIFSFISRVKEEDLID